MKSRRHNLNRRGAVLMLAAFLLPVIFVLAAFTINLAYVQLSRTQMMVATDASARAAGRALSEFQDVELAKEAAEITAALNEVSGVAFAIDADAQIEFGNALNINNGVGRYGFEVVDTSAVQSGVLAANAVRVRGKRDATSGGQVQGIFPGFGLPDAFDLQFDAVAMQVDRDIALVLDRSGSMDWVTFDWPADTSPWDTDVFDEAVDAGVLTYSGGWYYYASGEDSDSFQSWAWENYFELGDAPKRPWDDLKLAVESFLDVLDETVQAERVSLSSYSSSSSTDLQLTEDYPSILTELDTLGPSGATAIGYGMESGQPTLYESGFARPLAAKTLIIMTDGMHNTGTDPVTVAESIVADYKLTIHTVTFSPGADQARMQEVADIGGGQHYHANSGSELVEVFREIANNLPTIITQ